jgi:hypothetical protein
VLLNDLADAFDGCEGALNLGNGRTGAQKRKRDACTAATIAIAAMERPSERILTMFAFKIVDAASRAGPERPGFFSSSLDWSD